MSISIRQGTSVAQPYLAAFDVVTGAYRRAFRPVLNGKVNALVALPNGLLAVGGEFTTVNGTARAGLVVLDPATGQIVPGFTSTLEYRRSVGNQPGTVTGLAVSGPTLYVAGAFTHVAGGGGGFAYAKRGGPPRRRDRSARLRLEPGVRRHTDLRHGRTRAVTGSTSAASWPR